MEFMKKLLLLLSLLLATYAFTAKKEAYSGSLDITRECGKLACVYTYTLTNSEQSGNYIKPRFEALITDCSGNIIEEETIYFDRIMKGRYQKERRSHYQSEDGAVTIKILTAYSGWSDSRKSYKMLDGVHGWTYSWGCED